VLATSAEAQVFPNIRFELPISVRFEPPEDEYRTPLAGERYETELFGEHIVVERRDRAQTTAVSLGGGFFAPSVGGSTSVPMLALYSRGTYTERRYRLVSSGVVNDLEFAERFGVWEALAEVHNYTIPAQRGILVGGKIPDETLRVWGTAGGALGGGLSIPVKPGGFENAFRVGLLYRGYYEYHQRGEDAPKNLGRVATDTYVHGFQLKIRLDAIQRNLLELPHSGLAFGIDLSWSRRDHWRDFGRPGLVVYDEDDTRDFYQLRGYSVLVLPVPMLSMRHRLMAQVHFGWAPADNLDRYSGFQITGGPIPTESGDLARPPFPGATFDDFPMEDFVVTTLEYRYELAFFCFLHFRAAYGVGKVPEASGGGNLRYKRRQDYGFGAGITTGFLWDSLITFEVGHTVTGSLRSGQEGTGFVILWSKSF